MKTWDEIWDTMAARRNADSALVRQMIDIRDRYNAHLVIPIRDADTEPELPHLGPQLIHNGIENTAMRANQTFPQIVCPALDPSKETGVRSREYAAIRSRAAYASLDFSLFKLLAGRCYRQLAGYGAFAAIVAPDFEYERAVVELRDPLTAYPELRNPGDMRPPRNAGFISAKSNDYLLSKFGVGIFDIIGMHPDGDGLWDMVEWIDEDDIVIGILGPRPQGGYHPVVNTNAGGLEVLRIPNRADCVPVATPRRVTLDTIAGQMDSITGVADWLDQLMALNVLAAEKNIFPDMYVLGEEFRTPELISGEWQDGRTGNVNMISGARAVGQLVSTTGPMTQSVISQLERSGNAAGGNIPQYGGEAPGSLRTGRAIDTLGAFSVDHRIEELQSIMSATLARSIIPAIFEVEKGYFAQKKYTVFSGWPGDAGHVEYQPSKHFESNEVSVAYAFPGTDVTQISVAVLQLVGGGLMSRRTARVKHPMIDDAVAEDDQVVVENLEAGILAALQAQIQQGALPAIDAAAILSNLRSGMAINDAVIEADKAARKRQAELPPEPGPEMAMAPQSAPGLSMPGQGAEGPPSGPASVQAPAAGQQNLRDLLRAVRSH